MPIELAPERIQEPGGGRRVGGAADIYLAISLLDDGDFRCRESAASRPSSAAIAMEQLHGRISTDGRTPAATEQAEARFSA